MLPQFGFTEFLFIAIIALIVVGPKDLPTMMRKLGQFVARGRSMAREFQSAFDDIARQTELEELRKEIEDLRRDNEMTRAVDELKRTEADINRKVMMGNEVPQTSEGAEGSETTPDAPDAADEASPDTSPYEAATPDADEPPPADDPDKKAGAS